MDIDQRIAWESRCIQEEPPACSTACPLHVDVRKFLKDMAKGDMEAAYQTLKKSLPFPGIMGRICDQPCESKCRRGEKGGAIAIGALEKLCVKQRTKPDQVRPLPRKSKRIAVLGSGLAGLTTAWDLLKKGMTVVIFEREKVLAPQLRKSAEDVLPESVIEDELAVLGPLRAGVKLNACIDKAVFDEMCGEFDAIFIDRTVFPADGFSLKADPQGGIVIDPATGQTDREGVFAGGNTGAGQGNSPVLEAAAGRKGALSIERYLQKVHMTIGRENEGPYDTRLYTNLTDVAPLGRVAPVDPVAGFSSAEARREAGRCIGCECLECVKNCQYLTHYQKFPKAYIREFFNNDKVLHGACHSVNILINSCSMCGMCKTVCPNDLFMGEVCMEGKRSMLKGNYMPPSAHEFALKDMEFSRGESFALCRHEPGKTRSAYLYFPSCQLCGSSPGEVLESYDFLRQNLEGGVGIMLGCCGAPAYWAGRETIFRETMEAFKGQWQAMGKPTVITACTSCQTLLSENLPEITFEPLWTMVAGIPAAKGTHPLATKTVAMVDPCASRHDGETRGRIREIASDLGFVLEELPHHGELAECCGYGGLVFNANPKLDDAIISRRASESDRDYLAYCAMCRDKFVAAGKPTAHLIELLFPVTADADPWARGWLSWSQRQDNRGRVKQELLAKSGEKGERVMESYQKITMHIAPGVLRAADGRRILENDLKQVIYYAEDTGKRLLNVHTGYYRACHTIGYTTFWVDYSPENDGFRVHNAYSHRMKITGVK